MSAWQRDKAWSDRFIPAIKQAVGPHLLTPAPLTVDQREASDLIVLDARGLRIAARVRRHDYFLRFPDEFTLRSGRDSGAVTELAKIMDGFGDWLFYGFADEADDGRAEGRLRAWRLLDLAHFRCSVARLACQHGHAPGAEQDNGDGTRFYAFKLADFPPSPWTGRRLVIAEHGFGLGGA